MNLYSPRPTPSTNTRNFNRLRDWRVSCFDPPVKCTEGDDVKDRVPAAVFLVFGVALGQAATAAVIYDSGVAISEINHGGYSCSNCPGSFETADRFVLNVADNTTVTDVHWWGMYFNASTTQADSFEIRIYTDNPSNPGLPTNVGTEISLAAVGSGGRVATGEVVATGGGLGSSIMAGLPIFGYSAVLATPFEAAVGTTYWISIVNTSAAGWVCALQEPADVSSGYSYIAQSSSETPIFDYVYPGRMAFQLTGTVPEPTTFALFGLGLAGIAAVRRKKLPA